MLRKLFALALLVIGWVFLRRRRAPSTPTLGTRDDTGTLPQGRSGASDAVANLKAAATGLRDRAAETVRGVRSGVGSDAVASPIDTSGGTPPASVDAQLAQAPYPPEASPAATQRDAVDGPTGPNGEAMEFGTPVTGGPVAPAAPAPPSAEELQSAASAPETVAPPPPEHQPLEPSLLDPVPPPAAAEASPATSATSPDVTLVDGPSTTEDPQRTEAAPETSDAIPLEAPSEQPAALSPVTASSNDQPTMRDGVGAQPTMEPPPIPERPTPNAEAIDIAHERDTVPAGEPRASDSPPVSATVGVAGTGEPPTVAMSAPGATISGEYVAAPTATPDAMRDVTGDDRSVMTPAPSDAPAPADTSTAIPLTEHTVTSEEIAAPGAEAAPATSARPAESAADAGASTPMVRSDTSNDGTVIVPSGAPGAQPVPTTPAQRAAPPDAAPAGDEAVVIDRTVYRAGEGQERSVGRPVAPEDPSSVMSAETVDAPESSTASPSADQGEGFILQPRRPGEPSGVDAAAAAGLSAAAPTAGTVPPGASGVSAGGEDRAWNAPAPSVAGPDDTVDTSTAIGAPGPEADAKREELRSVNITPPASTSPDAYRDVTVSLPPETLAAMERAEPGGVEQESDVPVRPGQEVEATDGSLGLVDRIERPDDGSEPFLVVRGGLLFKSDMRVPFSAIDRVEGDTVRLKIEKQYIRMMEGDDTTETGDRGAML